MFIRKESVMALSFFEKPRVENLEYHGMKIQNITGWNYKISRNEIDKYHGLAKKASILILTVLY